MVLNRLLCFWCQILLTIFSRIQDYLCSWLMVSTQNSLCETSRVRIPVQSRSSVWTASFSVNSSTTNSNISNTDQSELESHCGHIYSNKKTRLSGSEIWSRHPLPWRRDLILDPETSCSSSSLWKTFAIKFQTQKCSRRQQHNSNR